MGFHEKLRRLFKDMNMSAVCRRAGLKRVSVGNMLARESMPAVDTAAKLARALDVDPGWLIDDERNWPPVRTEHLQKVA
jgi:transcriptional regulator with XRE-family HTH domain